MKLLITFLMLLQVQPVILNKPLAARIDSMFKEDQRWRLEWMKLQKKEPAGYSAEAIQQKWKEADSINEVKAKEIIGRFGFPSYNQVGVAAGDHFWAIIQHCDNDVVFQKKVLALMKTAIATNNASKDNYAHLVDRVLLNQHKKQLYGTQCELNAKTHKLQVMPLQYPAKIDALRKSMGLQPMKAYIDQINNDYGY